jgi:hypothetical protein
VTRFLIPAFMAALFTIYEYGYMFKKENEKDKYILIQWQEYMK